MATLIDGYNLLHVIGIADNRVDTRALERARHKLLDFLAASLTVSERSQTTIVFDAKNAPPGLPRELRYHGMRVLFAVGHDDADELLEALIRGDSSPRKLLVVSSDHQIQRAATRRRAKTVDSDRWYDDVCRQSQARGRAAATFDERPETEPANTDADVAYWIKVFTEPVAKDQLAADPIKPGAPGAVKQRAGEPRDDKPDGQCRDLPNPFPPGYADDLWEDD